MVGNGGDTLSCREATQNSYSGLYALDYLMTMDQYGDGALVVPDNWQKSLDRIQALLAEKYPALVDSLQAFRANIDNTSDWTKARIWLDAPQGLVNLNDQNLTRKIPANCGGQNPTAGLNVIQTVVRQKRPNIIEYEVDYSVFNGLQTRPLQFSFLMIHEWLWDLTDDPAVIRLANRFLHSKAAATLSPTDFQLSLNNIGISSRKAGFVSFCDRSPSISAYYSKTIGKGCAQITQADLDSMPVAGKPYLNLENEAIQRLLIDDFANLEFLQSIQFLADHLSSFPDEIFAGLNSLERFEIEGNQLTEIPVKALANAPNLKALDVSRNHITDLPPDLFSRIPNLAVFSAYGNQIHEIPPGFLSHVPTLGKVTLDLRNNAIAALPPGLFCDVPKEASGDILLNNNRISPAEINRINKEVADCVGKRFNVMFTAR